MIIMPEHVEHRIINLCAREKASTDKILEWALDSLEFDLSDVDDAKSAIAEIEAHGDKVLSLDEFNKALAHGLDN